MRDAARQAADRLHLLRVAQLLLELAAGRLGGLAVGHLAAQFVVDAGQRGGALVNAALEIPVRLVQGQLAGAQLPLRVVALGDVAQDQHDLRLFHRQQARLVEPRRRCVGAELQLQVHRGVVPGDAGEGVGDRPAGRGVQHIGNGAPGHPAARRLRVRRALHVQDHALLVEPENLVGKRADQRPQLGAGLQQFLRAQLERSLEHGAIVVELPVGLVHRLDHRRERGGNRCFWKDALQLAAQQTMKVAHHQRSGRVVTVIVWLWSSHRALGVNGEIST